MSFYTDVLMKDPRFNSTNTINDVSLLEPGTRAAVAAIIADAKAMGHDLRVGETYRSQARQHQVFMAGASHLSKVGCHGYGIAADLQLFEGGQYVKDGGKYNFLLALCKKHGMVSGIDWGHTGKHNSQPDAGHVQRVPIWRQPALFSRSWYPPTTYDPWQDVQGHG